MKAASLVAKDSQQLISAARRSSAVLKSTTYATGLSPARSTKGTGGLAEALASLLGNELTGAAGETAPWEGHLCHPGLCFLSAPSSLSCQLRDAVQRHSPYFFLAAMLLASQSCCDKKDEALARLRGGEGLREAGRPGSWRRPSFASNFCFSRDFDCSETARQPPLAAWLDASHCFRVEGRLGSVLVAADC